MRGGRTDPIHEGETEHDAECRLEAEAHVDGGHAEARGCDERRSAEPIGEMSEWHLTEGLVDMERRAHPRHNAAKHTPSTRQTRARHTPTHTRAPKEPLTATIIAEVWPMSAIIAV